MPKARNPYRTAPGSDPPELAGRDAELGAARYAIEMTAAGEPAKPLVFTGLRGMGKTALLRRAARIAKEAGAVTIVGEADRSLRYVEVMRRELTDALAKSDSLPVRLSTSIGRIVANLPKISYDVPHDAGSISLAGNENAEQSDLKSSDSLEDVLAMLNDHLHRHGRFLMIGLDELQEAAPDDLLRIIRVVHRTAGTDRPVLFIGAGLPNSGAVLQRARTYTERWAYFRLELLTRSETYEAVAVPSRELGVIWDQGAVEEIYLQTHGYPYFVLEFASAAWTRHKEKAVTREDVVAITAGVQRLLDEGIYDRAFAQLSPREVLYVLALQRLGPGARRPDDIAKRLGHTTSADLSSVRTQLIKKGIIYAPARGLAEFRLPLTFEYIERHREVFMTRSARVKRGGGRLRG